MTENASAAVPPAMERWPRLWIGVVWLPLLTFSSAVGLLWSFSYAERADESNESVNVQWFGPDFTLTPTTSVLLTAAIAALAGSAVHVASTFVYRLGQNKLEQSYRYWYLIRPLSAAALGIIFALALISGLLVLTELPSDGSDSEVSVPAIATVGALAGLFSERVTERLRRLVSPSPAEKSGKGKANGATKSKGEPGTTGGGGERGGSEPSEGTAR